MGAAQVKRPHPGGGGKPQKKFKKGKKKPVKEGGAEEVLLTDIRNLLEAQKLSDSATNRAKESEHDTSTQTLPAPGSEIEVEVFELSSTGDGLARQKGSDRIYVVPFTVPGDTVKVKVYSHLDEEQYSTADFLSVAKASPLRDDTRIQCPYFARCSGCQFQMLDYSEQLKAKKRIVEKAFRNFSQLPPELIPAIQDTMGSPLQYGYRTKLTPHFDGPPGWGSSRKTGSKPTFNEVPAVGFMQKAPRRTIDIEDCPIATEAVRKGMKRERDRMTREFKNYHRGATILLRESTQRFPKTPEGEQALSEFGDIPSDAVKIETDTHTDIKTCITDHKAINTEYIDDFVFTNPANSFFQNNNSILPPFTAYIREHILPRPSSSPSSTTPDKPIKYLVDAYSGSGLFTITQSSVLSGSSIGIDIDEQSISFARKNAALNALPADRCRFIAADAPELFKSVGGSGGGGDYDPDQTVVVLDPPRKGCDAGFLSQLLRFGPRRVVYVSCNVHTQARDVGVLVRGEVKMAEGEGEKTVAPGARYEIESLRGFDFFPQTGHVEGVAVLNRVDAEKATGDDVKA